MPIDMVIWLLVIAFFCGVLFAVGIVVVAKKPRFNVVAALQSYSYFRVVRKPSSTLGTTHGERHDD